jgi:hypothetical protein
MQACLQKQAAFVWAPRQAAQAPALIADAAAPG